MLFFKNTCIDLKFRVIDNNVSCTAKIYEGESFGGHRKDLRFEAKFILPNRFLNHIEVNINYALSNYLEFAYENYLEQKKKNWISKMKSDIIADIDAKIKQQKSTKKKK